MRSRLMAVLVIALFGILLIAGCNVTATVSADDLKDTTRQMAP